MSESGHTGAAERGESAGQTGTAAQLQLLGHRPGAGPPAARGPAPESSHRE